METTIDKDADVKIIRKRETRDVVHFIKAWRKHRHLTVDSLGERAGISGSMISQLERGKTTYTQKTLEAIADALDVPPWRLLASGPEEGKELWYRAMGKSLEGIIKECDRPDAVELFNTMTSNSWEANVKTMRSIYERRKQEAESAGF